MRIADNWMWHKDCPWLKIGNGLRGWIVVYWLSFFTVIVPRADECYTWNIAKQAGCNCDNSILVARQLFIEIDIFGCLMWWLFEILVLQGCCLFIIWKTGGLYSKSADIYIIFEKILATTGLKAMYKWYFGYDWCWFSDDNNCDIADSLRRLHADKGTLWLIWTCLNAPTHVERRGR